MTWTDIAVIAPVAASGVGIAVLVQLRRVVRRLDLLSLMIANRTKPPEGKGTP